MIRVAAFTSSLNDPSSRFRMRQLFEPLRQLGIEAEEFRPWISKFAPASLQLTGLGLLSRACSSVAARKHDVAWLNREFVTGFETMERFAGKRRLLDVDDAIWLEGKGPGRSDFARRIAGRCQGVIAGNECIAEYFRRSTERVWIVPTAVDTQRWTPGERFQTSGGRTLQTCTIGWSGTAWNLAYLYGIEGALVRFLDGHQHATLLVVSDRPPRFQALQASRFEFQRWTPETEVAALRRMDVGIMPLPDDEWTRAKCAMKMLCYMAVGLPVVVSPVGVAQEILGRGNVGLAASNAGEWVEALAALYQDRERAAAMGREGRSVVEQHYSVQGAASQLASIFTEVASQ
jgi:glycosyltransferase involved in cell wall biosynthesis